MFFPNVKMHILVCNMRLNKSIIVDINECPFSGLRYIIFFENTFYGDFFLSIFLWIYKYCINLFVSDM